MLNLYKLQKHSNSDKDNDKIENNSEQPADLNKYIDPENKLSTQSLKRSLWYVKHKVLLYKISITFLILFNTSIWVGSLYKWGFFIWEIPEQAAVERSLVSLENYSLLNANFSAQPLQIVGVQAFLSGVDKYDAVAEVVNVNKKHIILFEYHFQFDNNKTNTQTSFLLPGQSRPIAVLGVDSKTNPSNLKLIIEDTRWKRIPVHEISDASIYQETRLNFKVSDFSFTRFSAGNKDSVSANIVKFKLTNNTPFGYKNPKFLLGMYQGSGFVGVLPINFDSDFNTLDLKQFDLRSYSTALLADRAIVFPLIDVYNKEVYSELPK